VKSRVAGAGRSVKTSPDGSPGPASAGAPGGASELSASPPVGRGGNARYLLDRPAAGPVPLGRLADLRDHLREAQRLAETLEDRLRLGQVSAYISNHAWITGDLPRALASGRRALALAEALADRGLAVEANLRLGQVHWSLGQYREADVR
jgi:hypothetical protein